MAHHYVKVAVAGEIHAGKMKCVSIAGNRILLANVDGTIYATADSCTHEEASLSSGVLRGEWVKCPLHNSRFNVCTGKVMEEPAEEDLKTYPVRIEGENILIGLEERPKKS
jgi:nitrite reductase/ring-hydroxylating ferredoxin subunit